MVSMRRICASYWTTSTETDTQRPSPQLPQWMILFRIRFNNKRGSVVGQIEGEKERVDQMMNWLKRQGKWWEQQETKLRSVIVFNRLKHYHARVSHNIDNNNCRSYRVGAPGSRIDNCEFKNWMIVDTCGFRDFRIRWGPRKNRHLCH